MPTERPMNVRIIRFSLLMIGALGALLIGLELRYPGNGVVILGTILTVILLFAVPSILGLKLRTTYLSLVAFGFILNGLMVKDAPGSWPILILFSLISAPLIFDKGRAKAIDDAYELTRDLHGSSSEADRMLYSLRNGQARGARFQMATLKAAIPEHAEKLQKAMDVLEPHAKS